MNTLAKKKWFVPLVILILMIIALSSFADGSESDNNISTEKRLEDMCNSVRGVSNAKVMITYEPKSVSAFGGYGGEEKILGVAVVCDGGESPQVQLALYEMIEALFNVKSTRITVSGRNQNN